jgi:hypothetical protein
MRGRRVQRWSQVFAVLERCEGKEQVWIYCVVFVVATISPLVVPFFWVVFLLFFFGELRVEHSALCLLCTLVYQNLIDIPR